MKKGTRLEPLAELAGLREADAARRLAAMLRQLQEKQAELDRLRQYLAEYGQHARQGAATVDTARLQNARSFLSRLSEAVALQQAEVDKAAAGYRSASESWQDSRKQAKTFATLLDRYHDEELLARERREQAELDERAARADK